MADLQDGQTTEMQGSGVKPYILKNVAGVYSCSCPSWRNQSLPINVRTCKHLRKFRGDAVEEARITSSATNTFLKSIQPIKSTEDKIAELKELMEIKPTQPKTEDGEYKHPTAKFLAETIIKLQEIMKDKVTAPPLLLAHTWDGNFDPTGWWMSEKLDGVRALWQNGQFITRQGNVYHAPQWFKSGLPLNHTLDGELWIGRKKFQRTVSIVRRQDKSEHWKEVRYLVFDAPSVKGVFEQRLAVAEESIKKSIYAHIHAHYRVRSLDQVKEELKHVEELGGEGLMLRKPNSLYEAGRSTTLLKVKSFKDDEATIVGYTKGKGRHKGRVGALLVKLKDGIEFEIGTGLSDAERNNPPKIGSIIKFKYQELSDGNVPRFASYLGERED